MSMVILETERLLLRIFQPHDVGALATLYSDHEVMRFTGGVRTANETWESLQRMIRHFGENRFGLYATVLKVSGRLIGRCGFIVWPVDGRREIEVAYLLTRDQWGKGLATEAARALVAYGFKQLSRPRLISLIRPDNARSIRVAEKIGMKFERDVDVKGAEARLYARNS